MSQTETHRQHLASLRAQKAELERLAQDVSATVADDDDLWERIESKAKEIARAELRLDALQRRDAAERGQANAKEVAETRKATEKALDRYQGAAERYQQALDDAATAHGQMLREFEAFEKANPDRDATAYSQAIKPHSIHHRCLERFAETVARQQKRDGLAMPASSARIERFSVADAFGRKRPTLLSWLTK